MSNDKLLAENTAPLNGKTDDAPTPLNGNIIAELDKQIREAAKPNAYPKSPNAIGKMNQRFLKNPQMPDSAIPNEFFKPTLSYLKTLTDATPEFLFMSLLMTGTAVSGNRVNVKAGQTIKANLYACLLAASTTHRKSTAVIFARRFLSTLEEKADSAKILMPDSGSLEGLIDVMREPREIITKDKTGKEIGRADDKSRKDVQNAGIACYGEFDSFLSVMTRDYNNGYEAFILDVYDGNAHRRSLKNEETLIKNPSLSIIGASTLAQIRESLTDKALKSGFLQRFMFCYSPEREDRPRPKSLVEINAPDAQQDEAIVEMLKSALNKAEEMKQAGSTLKLSDGAKEIYQASFNEDMDFLAECRKDDADTAELITSYLSRHDVMKVKVAMIYEVFRQSVARTCEMEISAQSMEHAVETVRYFFTNTVYLLTNEFKFSKSAQKVKSVVDTLKQVGGEMKKRKLLQRKGWSAKEFNEVLESGVESGFWEIVDRKEGSSQTSKFVVLLEG